MANVSERKRDLTRVAEFYDGKGVFMTGAAGYVGVVLLETLLRCCPGITKVYILLRPKKGVQPECRKDEIIKRKVFNKLKEENPSALNKVHVVCGDIARPNLGLCEEDYQTIINEVSVVFHVAATISFLKPLRFTLENNVIATESVIELCKKLKSLDVVVFTSTAFSNSNRFSLIREDVYGLPYKSQVFLDALKKEASDAPLMSLYEECLPRWPNYYTFSKCLSENLIQERARGLPVAIVRPSIVFSSWKGAMPGYIEDGSGMVAIAVGVGKGFIKVINGYPESKMDMIPVDIVANTHVLAGFAVGTGRVEQHPLVVNCTTHGQFDCSLKNFTDVLLEMVARNPLPKSFQKATRVRLEGGSFRYWLATLYEHYLPGSVLDAMLRAMGKKPKIVRLYKFLDTAMDTLKYFVLTTWSYEIENFKRLDQCITEEDRKDLSVSLKGLSVEEYAKSLPSGAPVYEWELDSKPFQERQKLLNQRYVLTNFLKSMTLLLIGIVFYFILSSVFSTIPALI